MSDPFKKVSPGDPFQFPAAFYNALVDAVVARVRGGRPLEKPRDGTVIRVQNKTGAGLDELSVVAIGAPDLTLDVTTEGSFLSDPVMEANTPTADDVGKFAVLLAHAEDDGVVDAIVAGVAIVKIDAGDGTDSADVADGVTDSLIATASGSAKVLYRVAGSGKQWGVVRIGDTAAIPPAQYDGQLLQVTSQLTWGAGFLRLVNAPPT